MECFCDMRHFYGVAMFEIRDRTGKANDFEIATCTEFELRGSIIEELFDGRGEGNEFFNFAT